MSKKHELTGNIEEVNDAEIYDAIRYLEPDSRTTNEEQGDTAALVISVIFVILMVGLGFILLYR